MAEMQKDEIIPAEPHYERPNVRVCTDSALIRRVLPEGFVDRHVDKAVQAFNALRKDWDGQHFLVLAFAEPDAGRLYIYDSLDSDDDKDPVSHQVKLKEHSESAFRQLMGPMGWTW